MKPGPILTFALILAAAPGAPAQQRRQPEDPCARTSVTGYSDTPVLPGQTWRVHDIARPAPPVVKPGGPQLPVAPPADAVVLFDGKDLSQWYGLEKGKQVPGRWKVENGYMEVVGGTHTIYSKEKFGDAQIHVEWAAPAQACGTSQWRGNSGVLVMGVYEIQVLDSVDNPSYADGIAGSIYGQWPPLVNASRPRGEWQSYDLIFEAPKFEGEKLVKPAYITVIHNGVVVHHHKEIVGRMAHRVVGTYKAHGAEEPLGLQDHDVPVRYRNIWVRRLQGYDRR
jgi:hypothetical protein